MQLHKLLGGATFICGILGAGGLAGAVEFGTGYLTSITLLVIAGVCGYLGLRESGRIRR